MSKFALSPFDSPTTATTPAGHDLEKQAAGLVFDQSAGEKGHANHHYRDRAKERLRHFLHPDGRRIHVAKDPGEAERLRRQLEQMAGDEPFDIHISGSPEHLEALRQAQDHHEERAEKFKEQHGHLYHEFDTVRSELDALANELQRVTTHGVAMDAHFSRFGYNAHIKTYDNEDSAPHSGSTTPRSLSTDAKSLGGEESYVEPLKFFKKPTVRQYFHKGILWRASSSEEVQSFELFVDLLYVGIIAINGDACSEEPNGLSLLRFVITFTLSWKIWNDMALIISWFETDDIFQRFSILFLLACLFGMTTNLVSAFDTTYATLIGYYLAARLYMALYLLSVAILTPCIRPIMIIYVVSALLAVAIWIGSIHTDWPNQLATIWIAIFIDLCTPTLALFLQWTCSALSKRARAWYDKTFEFYPALNIEHRTERTNAFVTLVFGYTVVAMLYQSAKAGVDAFYGKAVLGLIQAFFFNWLYFEVDGSNLLVHAIRRHKMTAFTWGMGHLPFIMAFVLGGGALSRLVVAHDCPNTNLDDLTEVYQLRSDGEIASGIRWFYCAGFGFALLAMAMISASHVHKEIPGLRLKKRYRLAARVAVGIVMICLSVAEQLNSLQLIGTMTGLLTFALIVELWATSCCSHKMTGRSTPCRYVGNCGKKDLQAIIRGKKTLDIDEIGDRKKEGGLSLGPL